MRLKIYHFLVNRQPGIRERYHRFHDGAIGVKKAVSWLYLLWLNFCYYILFCHFLGKKSEIQMYEEKRLPLEYSESELALQNYPDIEEYVRQLVQYEIISFDIFDTLIFRPFSEPTDLFFFMGEKLSFLDFKRIRVQMEAEERAACQKENGHSEITLQDIWKRMERETGIRAEYGMSLEMEAEMQFCYANPFMSEVFQRLQSQNKKIIITSDMYLPEIFLKQLLEKNGFGGTEKLYISCEHKKNKASGTLFELVKQELPKDTKVIHVGDNPVSDVQRVKEHGFKACYYPNVNKKTLLYRAYDMSPIIGGAYRGIVNNTLYNGKKSYSMEYEYGFIYGGLFVCGYCSFIHEYCRKNEIDKVLFLARDGDILKQVYDFLYPDSNTEYVYWSRAAATKMTAEYNRYDYFRRYLYHKVNTNQTMEKIFSAMELQSLLALLPEGLENSSKLTDKNVKKVKVFLEEHWNDVLKTYREEQEAGKIYYQEILNGCRKVCAVDIGWAGSGAVALDYLVEKVWNLNCEVTGMIAGTNTLHNAEPDAGETFIQTGKLVPYLYASSLNRDLYKKHDQNRDYNIFWELLTTSPTKQFRGFGFERENGKVCLRFGNADANLEGICQIQEGIMDFAKEYAGHFGKIPGMWNISGRDAYAPMIVAASYHEKYLNTLAKKFEIEVNVT